MTMPVLVLAGACGWDPYVTVERLGDIRGPQEAARKPQMGQDLGVPAAKPLGPQKSSGSCEEAAEGPSQLCLVGAK
ncbi:hypothetical protein NDU88_002518 [Pleurodeles waltl]|uniref:Uncharacterized protein n=1 Tax=Pleurodeles waltl TaxID=8319 RepID=A0AAV7KT09_PLEWA|nr:hypothetical protein NDU88_002518 [Pleurodeles waltl]